ncbi:hypothetical protein GCU56_19780 [Geodermatophilus sabuli]|uniref:Uncharacterized protein n=1 Tax=Geodermatophilus sabuli TaxID=1564158 RepID=A0A7K3W5R3_9ACTN|nr:hypothetical protein [Geodermatophilus sabuli]NEK60101.1 hypothetical protein [Geodermatophilus sabuli]
MALDRTPAPRSFRVADDLTLSGLLDVLDRAEEIPPRRTRPGRPAAHRPGGRRLAAGPLPVARPVPVPATRPRPAATAPGTAAPVLATQPAEVQPAEVPAPRPPLRVRLGALVRRLALWGSGPGGAHLAWGRPAAPAGRTPAVAASAAVPAPRRDGPVLLTELPSTPTIQPVAPSPAAALVPARTRRPVPSPRVPVVAPLARQVPAPRSRPAPVTAQAGHRPRAARASSPARSRGDPAPPSARGSPPS